LNQSKNLQTRGRRLFHFLQGDTTELTLCLCCSIVTWVIFNEGEVARNWPSLESVIHKECKQMC